MSDATARPSASSHESFGGGGGKEPRHEGPSGGGMDLLVKAVGSRKDESRSKGAGALEHEGLACAVVASPLKKEGNQKMCAWVELSLPAVPKDSTASAPYKLVASAEPCKGRDEICPGVARAHSASSDAGSGNKNTLQRPSYDDSSSLKNPPRDDKDPQNAERGFSRTFPQRLMDVLNRKDTEHAVIWMPDGLSFVIINPRAFISHVLPKHFKQTKFASFTRKLNRWGFKRVTRGPNAGAYYHNLFQRDDPHLAAQMFCNCSASRPREKLLVPAADGSAMSDCALHHHRIMELAQRQRMVTHEHQGLSFQGLVNPFLSLQLSSTNGMTINSNPTVQGYSIGCLDSRTLAQQAQRRNMSVADSLPQHRQDDGLQANQPNSVSEKLSPQQIQLAFLQQRMLNAPAPQVKKNLLGSIVHNSAVTPQEQPAQQFNRQSPLQPLLLRQDMQQHHGYGIGQESGREQCIQRQRQPSQEEIRLIPQDTLQSVIQRRTETLRLLVAQQKVQLEALQQQRSFFASQATSQNRPHQQVLLNDNDAAKAAVMHHFPDNRAEAEIPKNRSQQYQEYQPAQVQQQQKFKESKLVKRVARGA